MREVEVMPKQLMLIVMLTAAVGSATLEAKELVLSPARVAAIVSPVDARDTRVLAYFELPEALKSGTATIVNAALEFDAGIEGAEFGMAYVFPVTKDWQSASSIAWDSPWSSLGGDYTMEIAGKSVALKSAKGQGRVRSNVTFIVMDWIAGRLPNNGLVIMPSQEDLQESATAFSFDKANMNLKINYEEK